VQVWWGVAPEPNYSQQAFSNAQRSLWPFESLRWPGGLRGPAGCSQAAARRCADSLYRAAIKRLPR
jgi:hypothetical protein